ncbi:RNA polymerase II subunit A C-terminal domain phosphatase-like [Saccoglossus kowalevskii]|uniref:RNA polymerase II subunit A C-terminal domain phosphatase n=1 Tax=Saccoglossus kowalevskii TaxID=10224 RepID=A0ABM0MIE3_SACKO|nr:PREDICTED: RNA polymerase II subunit A C-terminal domain phosphatase-like [Saccoglossus kowalevskii]
MASLLKTVCLPGTISCRITKWKVKSGSKVNQGTVLAVYEQEKAENGNTNASEKLKLKSTEVGTVYDLLAKEGQVVPPGLAVVQIEGCAHPTVMKDMCAECGADLRQTEGNPGERVWATTASISMVHSVPELQVSQEEAVQLAKEDEQRLLKSRKLVCIVDLDQTIIHTTMDNVPENLKDVYHFQLWSGPQYPWFHTRIRPKCKEFLEKISKLYELHIFTFGARLYAHMIAGFIDPDKKLFSHRIVSRDECFDASSKTANLQAIFPCGDNMVCIIDDREDVWNFAPNMIHVKPYHYFEGTGDINVPSGLQCKDMEQTGMPTVEQENNNIPKCKDQVEGNNGQQSKAKETSCETVKEEETPIKDLGEETDNNCENTQKVEVVDSDIAGSVEKCLGDPLNKGDSSEMGDTASQYSEIENANKSDVSEHAQRKNGNSKDKDINNSQQIDNDNTKEKYISKEKDNDNSKEIDDDNDKEKDNGNSKEKEISTKNENETESKDSLPDKDNDDYLMYLEDILVNIHTKFYNAYDKLQKNQNDCNTSSVPDLKEVVPSLRQVLKGTNILFSGVFPTNMSPEKSRAWKVAQTLGANVQSSFVPKLKDKTNAATATTHVVAAKAGTVKVKQAQCTRGIHIVTPEWLWCCYDRWERVDERIFRLKLSDGSSSTSSSRSNSPAIRSKDFRKKQLPIQPPEPPPVAIYDPVTGKRIRKDPGIPSTQPGTCKESGKIPKVEEKSTKSRKDFSRQPSISETVNPLYSFSSDELEEMDKEVEDIFGESDSDNRDGSGSSSSDSETLGSATRPPSSSSSGESLSGEHPRGWKRKRRPRDHDNDEIIIRQQKRRHDSSSSAGLSEDGDVSSDEDKMAAAIDDLLTYSKKL